jgi:hypothetical protein
MADALVERENLDSEEIELIMNGKSLPPMKVPEVVPPVTPAAPVAPADVAAAPADGAKPPQTGKA